MLSKLTARRTPIVAGSIIATTMRVHDGREGACGWPAIAPSPPVAAPATSTAHAATTSATHGHSGRRHARRRAALASAMDAIDALLHEQADAADRHRRDVERRLVLDADRRERHLQMLRVPMPLLGQARRERRDVEDVAQAVRRLLAIVVVLGRAL